MDLFDKAMDKEEREQASREDVLTVGQLTSTIKEILEGTVGQVCVRGEISNWRPASSGHIYFSLKDSEAVISAALFKGAAFRIKKLSSLKDGVEVLVRGRISVYGQRGTYQIIVESLEPVGEGGLQAKFEALKKKLQAEGLFDLKRKRPIPAFPSRIVVITSPTGAAIRDVLSVLRRRFSGIPVLIVPALVQGSEASGDLVRAIRVSNKYKLGDVLLLTRGGGSFEDLFCFNDEELAREIFHSEIPIVSAVGHEVDFTIADFVADLRAPTPSAAAELLVREKEVMLESIGEAQLRLARGVRRDLQNAKFILRGLISQMKSPRDRILDLQIRFDEWADRLLAAIQRSIEKRAETLERLRVELMALSPLQVLERGYSIAFDQNGRALRSLADLPRGMKFELKLHDGAIMAESEGRKE